MRLGQAIDRRISSQRASSEEPTTPHPDPGRRAAARLRPLPGQADGRRRGRPSTRRSSRTATTRSAPAVRAEGRRATRAGARSALVPLGNDRFGGVVHGRPARALAVRGHRVDRPRRDLAGRAPAQGRGGPGATSRGELAEGAVLLGRDDADGRGGRSRRQPGDRHGETTLAPRSRSTSTASSRGSAPGTSSSRARGAASAASPRRCPKLARARLRRRLPAADPPDRHHEPQGPEQRARGRSRTTSARRGRSARRRAATTRSIPTLGTWAGLRRDGRGGATRRASRSRSTSRSSARPTTRG